MGRVAETASAEHDLDFVDASFADVDLADVDLAEGYPRFVTLRLLEEGSGVDLRHWFRSRDEPDLEALQARRLLTLRSLRFWRLAIVGTLDTDTETITSPGEAWWPL